MREIDKDYGSDYIKKKEAVRNFLKNSQVNPWSKAVVLGVQVLVLILLYQVFIGGLNAKNKFEFIYPFITSPDYINTHFLWFDLSKRNWILSTIVGIFLFIEIIISQNNRKEILSRRDQMYKIFFPIFSIIALGLLPSVKSVFILTSIIFSIILILVMSLVGGVTKAKKTKNEAKKSQVNLNDITIKRI